MFHLFLSYIVNLVSLVLDKLLYSYILILKERFYFDFFLFMYDTASSAAPQIQLCVGGCWDRTQTVATTTLAVRRSNHSARSHPLDGIRSSRVY
jgi:hypothetical protein